MPEKRFKVVDGPVTIRKAANGERLTVKLQNGEVIAVDSASMTVTGGYVWWKHTQGWSAEKSTDGKQVFMTEFNEAAAAQAPAGAVAGASPAVAQAPVNLADRLTGSLKGLKGQTRLVTTTNQVKIRSAAGTKATHLISINEGEVVEADMTTLTEANGYYWVKHNKGWSALQDVSGQTVFFADGSKIVVLAQDTRPEALPLYQKMIVRLPVAIEQVDWVQYFGNTTFAVTDGSKFGYGNYAQALHGGFDFGNSNKAGVPILAGVTGTYIKTDRPNANNVQVWVKVEDYIVIYQHIFNVANFSEGQAITPDTQIAEIHHRSNGGWDHLHFEVRYKEWIVNPLPLLAPELLSQITSKFHPDKIGTGKSGSELYYFFRASQFNKWSTPLDQPLIKRGGPKIGPMGG
ncbi:MAG: peptidoglycan DD-metalloendopeptidase family protein [Phototrophicaceae bacterium]